MPHHLRGRGVAEGRLGGEELDALYDVGLADRVRPDENGKLSQIRQFEMGIVPKIDELQTPQHQPHG